MNFFDKMARLPFFRFFLTSNAVWKLVLKCLLLILIAYSDPWICGLVFDYWLKWRTKGVAVFTFCSFCVLSAISLLFIVWAIIRFARKKT